MEKKVERKTRGSFRLSETAFQAMLASGVDAVFGFDKNLKISHWNNAAATLSGISGPEAATLGVFQVFPLLPKSDQVSAFTSVLLEGAEVLLKDLALASANSGVIYCSASCYPLFSADGEITGGYALLREAGPPRQFQQKLADAEQLLNLVSEFAGQVICKISATGTLLEVNRLFEEVLGFSEAEVVGRNVFQFFHPDDFLAFRNGLVNVLDDARNKPALHRFRHKCGHYIWLESFGRTLRDPDALLLQEIVVVARPLTQSPPIAQPEKSNSPAGLSQLELVLAAADTGAWSWSAATEMLSCDERARQLFGLAPDQTEARFADLIALVHPPDRQRLRNALRQTIVRKEKFQVDFRIRVDSGQMRFLHSVGGLLCFPDGTPDQILGLSVDVTEQRLAEEKLREQEARLASVMNSSLSAIVGFEPVTDQAGNITDLRINLVNRLGAQMLGRKVEELQGKSFLKEYPGVKEEGIFDKYVQVINTGQPVLLERFYAHDGLNAWYSIQAAPNGPGLTATFTDITALKESQQQLLEKQYFQEKVNQTTPLLVAVLNLTTKQATYTNKPLTHFLQYRQDQNGLTGLRLLQSLLHPHDRDRLQSCLQQVVSTPDYDVLRFQFRMRDRQEGWRWFQVFVKVFRRNAAGHVEEVLCLVQDIDEAEQNKFLLKGMLDSSLSGIMAFESVRNEAGQIVDFTWVLMNKPAEQLIGRKSRYVLGRRMLTEMPGNLNEGIFHKFAEVVETGNSVQFEHYYTFKGCLTWFLISAVKMDDGFTATFTDITLRKEAETELLESKLFTEKITANAPFLIGVYNPVTGKSLYYNRHLGTMLGYSAEDIDKFAEDRFTQIVHPDDQPRLARHFAALLQAKDGEVIETETRIRAGGGAWKWLYSRDSVFRRDQEGNVVEVLTMVSDISEEKYQADLLKSVVGATKTGISALQAVRNAHNEIIDFTWLLANGFAAELVGQTESSVAGKSVLQASPVLLRNGLFADFVNVAEAGVPVVRELFFEGKGKQIWVRANISKLADGVVALLEDISSQKNACPEQSNKDNQLHEALHQLNQMQQAQQQYNAGLNARLEELSKASADLDILIQAAAQHLKQPVAGMRHMLSSLAGRLAPHDTEAEKTLARVHDALSLFEGGLAKLPEMVKAAKTLSQPATTFGLARLIEELKTDLHPLFEQKNAQLEYQLEVPKIRFPRQGIYAILNGLLSYILANATPQPGPQIQISTTRTPANQVLLTVRCSGLTKSLPEQADLFGMFGHAHETAALATAHLYAVKQMLENEGGKIAVPNQENGQTVFAVYLPLQ